ncbi:Prolyl endopeptidase [Pseudolycoriella hygida]|uniref:Prolyl endopeptidase n=1 Tax=Pseudolycoriella hygida TaxID=35572 RepID=A0A9Q0NDB5_9DIPT|nr:Prolyl endopeptidase [Pseudolycoriella hygida]
MTTLFKYPKARRDESIVEDHHGTKVYDPYRWLEDPDSVETQEFVEEHNKITQPYLEGCDQWKNINQTLTKLWNYPKFTIPARHGDYYYYYMNTGLQNQNVLFKQESLTSEPVVFLDPNTLSTDGTIALAGTAFSHEGQYFAYSLSESGSDWIKIKIRDVVTGKDFDECLEKVKFSGVAWTKDDKGFFYSRYEQDGKTDGSETSANENQKLYYHRIGEPQGNDVLVAEFLEHPLWRIQSEVSDCGKYLFLSITKSCRTNLFFYVDLEKTGDIRGKLDIVRIVQQFEADYEYITNTGSNIVIRTDKNAPNYRLICIDLDNPEEKNWKTLIAVRLSPHENYWAACVNEDKLILGYIHNVKSLLQVHSLQDGHLIRTFPLDIGTIIGFSGKKKYSEIFYNFMSFLTPGKIYHYDFSKPDVLPTLFREINLSLEGFNSDLFAVNQVFYSSKDGTQIPMFIVQKKENVGTIRPCLLYGYGGFNISIQPTFSLSGLMFIDTFDGILAYPNIRGGGEYGEKWHSAGRLFNKQNCFDDFQWAAKYLVDQNYTQKDKIVIQGGSNGGLLVGACINQRPDLFGAAVSQVGVMDMLRFHKFTIGHAWISDYGNPDEKNHFENLIKFSPLHNVHAPRNVETQYPATLILTADHDDRVSPLHSLKFIAALHNEIDTCEHQLNPLLLRVYSKAGHGAGKPTTKKIEEATDILTFMYKALKLKIVKN